MSKYKVGDKAVLTVTGTGESEYYSYYVFNNNDLILWEPSTDKYAEPLSTYTEPLEAKIRRQAAEITRLLAENERLKAENKKMGVKLDAYELYGDQHEEEYNQAFNQGTEAAWELARKIILRQSQGGMNDEDYKGAFGSGVSETYVIKNYTYQEAAAKVAEWEKAKAKILVKAGDVLENIYDSNIKCIVTNLYPNNRAYLVFDDGTAGMNELDNFKKTGRHIDIDSFLKQIGEAE